MHVVVGTAGHIDHGKSALVKALTGTDPDRLKEEKERGMTTDLGFAFLSENVTIIDVPGHEKFVRHMLAGASTIDLVMLVVAADDSVMPQTREHFEICRLMGIRHGLVAVNKADLVDDDWLEMVKQDVAQLVAGSFLEGAPVVAVSAVTGKGIPELKQTLAELVARMPAKPDRGVFRMPIDRSFSIKGFGTVVAGTVLSGRCRLGDKLELLPEQSEVKVRGIQVHNQAVEAAVLGDRAALNLQGVERELVERGNVLATAGYYQPTDCLNATLYCLRSMARPLKNLSRVRVHIGTAEAIGRVAILNEPALGPNSEGLVQFRLEQPVVCDWGDRFVVRAYAPPETLGGGVVLEASAGKERRFDEAVLGRLRAILSGDTGSVLEQYLVKCGYDVHTAGAVRKEIALSDEDMARVLDQLLRQGKVVKFAHEGKEYLVHFQSLGSARELLLAALAEFHRQNPVRLGMKRAELREKAGRGFAVPLFDLVTGELVAEGKVVEEQDRLRLAGHEVRLKPDEQTLFDKVAAQFRDAGFETPSFDDALALAQPRLKDRVRVALVETGTLVDVGEGVVMHRDAIAEARKRIVTLFGRKPELTASEIRQDLGTSRKYAIPLLNYFDSHGLTQRKGEVRILRLAKHEDPKSSKPEQHERG